MLSLSPPHGPLCTTSDTVLYTNVWGQLLPPSHHARVLSLSPMTPNGENSRSLLSYQSGSIWYGIAGSFPIHVPLETGHVAGLGLLGSDAAYDYRWLSVTCKRAWTDLWQPPQLVLSSRP